MICAKSSKPFLAPTSSVKRLVAMNAIWFRVCTKPISWYQSSIQPRCEPPLKRKANALKPTPLMPQCSPTLAGAINPRSPPPVSEVQGQLAALTQWLTQLVDAQAIAKTQAEHHSSPFVRQQHQALVEHYREQIQKAEAELMQLTDSDPALKQISWRTGKFYSTTGVQAHFLRITQLSV